MRLIAPLCSVLSKNRRVKTSLEFCTKFYYNRSPIKQLVLFNKSIWTNKWWAFLTDLKGEYKSWLNIKLEKSKVSFFLPCQLLFCFHCYGNFIILFYVLVFFLFLGDSLCSHNGRKITKIIKKLIRCGEEC